MRHHRRKTVPPEVRSTINRLSVVFAAEGLFITFLGAVALLVSLVALFLPGKQIPDSKPFSLYFILALSVLGLSAGLFVVKVALDFRAVKGWTYGWARFLGSTNWAWHLKKDLCTPDLRKAFHQPELLYPEYPEYGVKLEDEIREKQEKNRAD